MILRYILAWIPMVFIAILNGAIRDLGYGKRLPELRAHQISTITALLLFGTYIFALTRLWQIDRDQAIVVGLIWLVLTLGFEFLFGHYVAKHPWAKLLHDYNILAGRLWILIPIWIAIAPYLFCLL
jgi:ATP adenylyltransferase/5',5'''-P-1,P-4-tetraphosphate phosphorylase II